jgi:hypothetical protein
LETFFVAEVGEEHDRYQLDLEVVQQFKLKGRIFYLPCTSQDQDGESSLRSIIHLGQSNGALDLSNEVRPLLNSLANSVADGMSATEDQQVRDLLRKVRKLDRISTGALAEVMDHVTGICHSIGCTLFLRTTLLAVSGIPGAASCSFVEAFKSFFNHGRKTDWEEITEDDRCAVEEMLAAFFGVSSEEVVNMRRRGLLCEFAALCADSLYMRATQSGTTIDTSGLLGWSQVLVLKARPFVPKFAEFLRNDCYLPGYGLTGWTLRYRHNMLLQNKHQNTITAFASTVPKKVPMLDDIFIADILSKHGVQSALTDSKLRTPEHADHIRDRENISRHDDTYLACLLEPIDDMDRPSGVLRTSTSVAVRSSFGRRDQEAVEEVAMHLSWLLRQAFMEQQQFARTLAERKQLRTFLHHHVKEIENALGELRKYVACTHDPKAVKEHLDFLETIRKLITESEDLNKLVDNIGKLNAIDLVVLRKYLQAFLEGPRKMGDVIVVVEDGAECAGTKFCRDPRRCLLATCLLAEEFITNAIRFSNPKPTKFVVFLARDSHFSVCIAECAADESERVLANLRAHRMPQMALYSNLLEKSDRRGQGTELLTEVTRLTGLKAEYGEHESGSKVYRVRCGTCLQRITGEPSCRES